MNYIMRRHTQFDAVWIMTWHSLKTYVTKHLRYLERNSEQFRYRLLNELIKLRIHLLVPACFLEYIHFSHCICFMSCLQNSHIWINVCCLDCVACKTCDINKQEGWKMKEAVPQTATKVNRSTIKAVPDMSDKWMSSQVAGGVVLETEGELNNYWDILQVLRYASARTPLNWL